MCFCVVQGSPESHIEESLGQNVKHNFVNNDHSEIKVSIVFLKSFT
jgi:hypothetical protein